MARDLDDLDRKIYKIGDRALRLAECAAEWLESPICTVTSPVDLDKLRPGCERFWRVFEGSKAVGLLTCFEEDDWVASLPYNQDQTGNIFEDIGVGGASPRAALERLVTCLSSLAG